MDWKVIPKVSVSYSNCTAGGEGEQAPAQGTHRFPKLTPGVLLGLGAVCSLLPQGWCLSQSQGVVTAQRLWGGSLPISPFPRVPGALEGRLLLTVLFGPVYFVLVLVLVWARRGFICSLHWVPVLCDSGTVNTEAQARKD